MYWNEWNNLRQLQRGVVSTPKTSDDAEAITVTSDPQYTSIKNLGSYELHSWHIDYTSGTGITATVQYSNNGTTFVTDTTCSSALGASGTTMLTPFPNGAAFGRVKFSGGTGCVATIVFNRRIRS